MLDLNIDRAGWWRGSRPVRAMVELGGGTCRGPLKGVIN